MPHILADVVVAAWAADPLCHYLLSQAWSLIVVVALHIAAAKEEKYVIGASPFQFFPSFGYESFWLPVSSI